MELPDDASDIDGVSDRPPVEGDHPVPGLEAGLLKGRTSQHLGQKDPDAILGLGEVSGGVDSQIRVAEMRRLQPIREEWLDVGKRNRKADPLRVRADGLVDADKAPVKIDKGAARIPGIDGGIGLEQILEVDIPLLEGAVQRGEDARRNGLPKPEGVSDCNHRLAQEQVVHLREGGGCQTGELPCQPQETQVAQNVIPKYFRLRGSPVPKLHIY